MFPPFTILVGNTPGVVAGELPALSRARPTQPAPFYGVSPRPNALQLGRGDGVGEALMLHSAIPTDGDSGSRGFVIAIEPSRCAQTKTSGLTLPERSIRGSSRATLESSDASAAEAESVY